MIPNLPKGQGPIDPQSAFVPPPTPMGGSAGTPGAHFTVGSTPQQPSPYPGGWVPGGAAPMGFMYPPPPRRGIWRTLVSVLLFLMLGGSFLLNLVLLSGAGSSEAASAITHSLRSGNPEQVVAVLEVTGPIDGNSAARFERLLDQIERDPNTKVLVVEVDSPGGTVTASDEIYARLLRYKASRTNAGKPATVVIAMRSSATSGGYYIACAGDHIFAEHTTLTGNIGVLWPRYNFRGLMEKYGVEETTVVATGADFKNLGSPFSAESEQGRQYIQKLVDGAFDRFKQVVTSGRGARISGKNVFDGRALSASEALSLGLIDQIGYPTDAYDYAAKAASLDNPQVVRYRDPTPGLLGVLFGGAEATAGDGTPNAQSVDLSAIMKPETLDAWRSGRLLYR